MKKIPLPLLAGLLALASVAHLLYWSTRYRATSPDSRSALILLGPARSLAERFLRR